MCVSVSAVYVMLPVLFTTYCRYAKLCSQKNAQNPQTEWHKIHLHLFVWYCVTLAEGDQ